MATALETLAVDAAACTRCRLAEGRIQVVFGVGDAKADLLFVGEGPGAEEDKRGEPFVGRSGQLLDQLVEEEMGLTRAGFHITNVVKCRPPGNRDPRPDEIEACSPYLEQQIDLIAPRVVVTLGRFAAQTLLESSAGIGKLRGRSYPFRAGVLIPTYHPAAALRGGGQVVAQIRADLVRAKQAMGAPGSSIDLSDEAESGGGPVGSPAEAPSGVAPKLFE